MARTDWVREIITPWSYIKPIGNLWFDLLVYGSNKHINFNTVSGTTWYGFRDNGWVMEFKNALWSWTPIWSWWWITDWDKWDITVTASWATRTIDNDVVTNAKLANMATQTFKGRTTAGTGDPEDLTIAQAKTMLNLAGTNTGDQDLSWYVPYTGAVSNVNLWAYWLYGGFNSNIIGHGGSIEYINMSSDIPDYATSAYTLAINPDADWHILSWVIPSGPTWIHLYIFNMSDSRSFIIENLWPSSWYQFRNPNGANITIEPQWGIHYIFEEAVWRCVDQSSSGGGGGTTITTYEADLGAIGNRSWKFIISWLSGLTIGKQVIISQASWPYSGKGTLPDESNMDYLVCNWYVSDPTRIQVYRQSMTHVRWNFKFNYFIQS